MKCIEHEQGLFQTLGGHGSDVFVVEQVDQGLDVVATDHGAQQFSGLGLRDQGDGHVTMRHGSQKRGFDLGRIVHAGGHAVGE